MQGLECVLDSFWVWLIIWRILLVKVGTMPTRFVHMVKWSCASTSWLDELWRTVMCLADAVRKFSWYELHFWGSSGDPGQIDQSLTVIRCMHRASRAIAFRIGQYLTRPRVRCLKSLYPSTVSYLSTALYNYLYIIVYNLNAFLWGLLHLFRIKHLSCVEVLSSAWDDLGVV